MQRSIIRLTDNVGSNELVGQNMDADSNIINLAPMCLTKQDYSTEIAFIRYNGLDHRNFIENIT